MSVLVLIIVMLTQVVNNATTSIQRSTKGMDSNQSATVAMDRIGESIAKMVASGSGTLVAIKNRAGSDGLAMITNGRVRSRKPPSDPNSNVSVDNFTNIRLGARGFCVINAPNPDLAPTSGGGSYPSVPMLHWGDGTVSWNAQNTTSVQGNPSQALSKAATDVQNQITSSGDPLAMLQFSPLGRSIFRFELAFLLSDGTTVSGSNNGTNNLTLLSGFSGSTTPLPRNKYFVANEAFVSPPVQFDTTTHSNAPAYPLASNAADSDVAPNNKSNGQNVYVSAVIVGIATLDPNTQRILSNAQLTQLAGIQTLPKVADGMTPIQTWDISSPAKPTYSSLQSPGFPPAVLQNIRFTQRSYYVH